MHWRLKAAIQTAIAALPRPLADAAYYQLQRMTSTFDGAPARLLKASAETGRRLVACGFELRGKTFLEVGTGRAPVIPLGFWLMGAAGTVTVDLHRYVREERIEHALAYVRGNAEAVRDTFGALLVPERLDALLAAPMSADRLLRLAGIRYLAPADAATLPLADASVDFHTSYTVLEHIPEPVIAAILREGNRVVRPGGAFAHLVDYSDHFSHGDPRIGPLHFLRYTDAQWHRLAGNRFMYMNRLRHDDMLSIFEEAGHRVIEEDPAIDGAAVMAQPLQPQFSAKPIEALAVVVAWLVTQPATG